jgi:hypothetical protein
MLGFLADNIYARACFAYKDFSKRHKLLDVAGL